MRQTTIAILTAASLAGCAVPNPAPVFDAEVNRTLQFPKALEQAGTQVKVRLPEGQVFVLVWRTSIGFGGTQLGCTHCGRELQYVEKIQHLGCPCGAKYRLDGSPVLETFDEGQTPRPLRSYVVEKVGDRLRILG